MGKKTDQETKFCSKERMHTLIDMMRKGLFQEITTETGEVVRLGRAPLIDSVEVLDKYIHDYLDYIDCLNDKRSEGEPPFLPDVPGFCGFIGISREQYANWKYIKSPEMCERLKTLETLILSVKQQMGLQGQLATIPLMADFNNNHGYTNAPQVIRHQHGNELPAVDEIVKRLPPAP
ncbi:MAG: hypothetical protein IKN54_02310 [Lachnospiraceae bacterium]|nr:hypothetical protein [Lachnospiraceae bacterium]